MSRQVYLDPYTQQDTRILPPNKVFSFTQNGTQYHFNKNMFLHNYRLGDGVFLINPYTRSPIAKATLNRLHELNSQNGNSNRLTNNEQNFNKGVTEILSMYREKGRQISYRNAANEYIQNIMIFNNNLSEPNLIRMKNNVIRKLKY
tara:strand:- start:194 stop:631 length:438 start_codon:yes stop_codon:yes gene_type:complete